MDKNAIKSFAIESRRQMIESVKYQASLIGITADGISEPISKAEGMETYDYGAGTHTLFDKDIDKRKSLVNEVKTKGFDNVVEEVAYTWFNRIIAIRFMEVNDYLPTRTRVLSSETEGKIEPDIITEALDLELDYSNEDINLILKHKEENELDDLFQFLFVKQSNKLNEILPGLFEKTDDYMELLLDISFINELGIVRQLIDNISEDDFKNQVEIIGWLYQYYITDLNNLIYDGSYKKEKISKDMLPFATQIFTPDWIVKYMVENSLGKLWSDNNSDSHLKDKFKYFVETDSYQEDFKLEDIKIIDPCMGSGHILVYVFEILMNMYTDIGYSNKDAVISILENNLYGLDIDDRAYQLAYFAIMMKARKYYRRVFDENILINLFSIQESNNINQKSIDLIINNNHNTRDDLKYICDIFNNAKEYGSILKVKQLNFNNLIQAINEVSKVNSSKLLSFDYQQDFNLLKQLIQQAKLLSMQYEVVVTNPPYLNSSRFNPNLVEFAKKEYADVSSDLSMMMYKQAITSFSKPNGYISFITTNSWMFLAKFEKLRDLVLNSVKFESIVDLGSELFEGKVGHNLIVAWVNKNTLPQSDNRALAIKLSEFNYSNRDMKESEFFNIENRFYFNQNQFNSIPGSPIAYWVSENFIKTFDNGICIDDISGHTGSQNKTANNNKYIRYFWEVSSEDIGVNNKWVFYAKGGDYRKYYGNLNLVVDWSDDARDFYKNNKTSNLLDEKYWFKEGITYTKISSKGPSFRYLPPNCIFDMGGPSICYLEDNLYYMLGLLNSNLANYYLDIFNPTLNIQSKDIRALPVIINEEYKPIIDDKVSDNIEIFKNDYYSHENTFLFKKHPLLNFSHNLIESCYIDLKKAKESIYDKHMDNELELNNLFLEIYDIDDISAEVNKEDIKLDLYDLNETIKSFISYVVGCMFGRYSLDDEKIQFAGGTFDLSNYSKFKPDDDNIIPVLDTEYFEDDIVGRFVDFIKVCFGEECLEANLDFIAGALNKKGNTSREIIRNYFLNDFFKDHAKMYKKCPIYWQFDSGKQNAFKCLIYMHRYEPGLVARVRTDYLHKTQKAIEDNLIHCDNVIANSSNKSEISKATKDKSKYIKQLDEIRVYDEALRHMATQNIEMDLDDGVKVNYAKFQKVEISIEGEKPKNINLLKNI